VEMTSINLMSTLEVMGTNDGRSIVNWLLKQRNSNGGFSSTQDTIRGLEALSEFATLLGQDGPLDLTVDIKWGDTEEKLTLSVNEDNRAVYQLQLMAVNNEYPESEILYRVHPESSGEAYLGITTEYYEKPRPADDENIFLELDYSKKNGGDCGELKITASWLKKGEASGMVTIKAQALSGCCFHEPSFDELLSHPQVRMLEYDCSTPVIYLNELTKEGETFRISMYVEAPVQNIQPRFVEVQQYYNAFNTKSVMYAETGMELNSEKKEL